MSDDGQAPVHEADLQFENADAGASTTYPTEAGKVRKGGHLVIRGRPCKVCTAPQCTVRDSVCGCESSHRLVHGGAGMHRLRSQRRIWLHAVLPVSLCFKLPTPSTPQTASSCIAGIVCIPTNYKLSIAAESHAHLALLAVGAVAVQRCRVLQSTASSQKLQQRK